MGQARLPLVALAAAGLVTRVRTKSYQGVGGTGAEPFHGVGGTGADPFFQGVGGTGAEPFFHGVGGTGADPLAINTEPSPWVVAAVFRPIAPAKTSMAASTTVEIRDIVPPRRGKTPRRHSIHYVGKVKYLLYQLGTHLNGSFVFDRHSPTTNGPVFQQVEIRF
jgi:hypothetical protein